MRQWIKITGYSVPWNVSDNKRAIFSNKAQRDDFFEAFKMYEREYRGVDFHPRQETISLSTDNYGGGSFEYLQRINYLRVEMKSGVGNDGGDAVGEWFYFIVDNPVQPTFENDDFSTITAKIRLDVWQTYVYPSAFTYLNTGTIIEQSSPLTNADGFYGVQKNDDSASAPATHILTAKTPFPRVELDVSTCREIAACANPKSAGAWGNFGARAKYATTWDADNAFYFVGIFGSSFAGTLVLARPLDVYGILDPRYVGLATLLKINKVEYCEVLKNGYVVPADNNITSDPVEVNLLRAYIIPRKALQGLSTDSGRGAGFRIKSTSDLGEYPQNNALANVNVDSLTEFFVDVNFNPREIIEGGSGWKTHGAPVFADIGTPTTRLEMRVPYGKTSARVNFRGQVTMNGYNLIMVINGRQVDLGGDFEIPVPDSAEAEAFARNKWSIALQGVSHVGGLAAAVISKNPVAIVGAAVSAGQYLTNIAEQQSVPSTIQGQGNGLLTYANAKVTAQFSTRGAVYCRFFFPTSDEIDEAKRWGYKWAAAWVNDRQRAGDAVFLNNPDEYPATLNSRVFIKTAGCGLSFTKLPRGGGASSVWDMAARSTPAWAVEELQELFNAGLFIYYNPNSDYADFLGGFGT